MSGFSQCVAQKIMVFTFVSKFGILSIDFWIFFGILNFRKFSIFRKKFQNFKKNFNILQIRIQNIHQLQNIDKLVVSKIKIWILRSDWLTGLSALIGWQLWELWLVRILPWHTFSAWCIYCCLNHSFVFSMNLKICLPLGPSVQEGGKGRGS